MKSKDIVIRDNEIITDKIAYYKFNELNSTWTIKYKNSDIFYHYSNDRVRIVKDSCNALKYMKEVSAFTAQDLKKENGENILYSQMKKVEVDDLNTALANYLNLSNNILKGNNLDLLIFPFGCNSSQYKAVENAIFNKISVIEGPPGTGKTQTILNIIANIIIRNMNCQVVSNNNAAIENIKEKLVKYNLEFISALLGKKDNKDLFVENQNGCIPNLDEFKNLDLNTISFKVNNKRNIVKKLYNTRNENANLIQKKNELNLEYKYFIEYVKNQNVELVKIKFSNIDKLKLLLNELISLKDISLWHRLKFIFFYRVGNFKLYKNDIDAILNSIKNIIYVNDIKELENEIRDKQEFIENNKKSEEDFINLSMLYFKSYLSNKYLDKRKIYTQKDIWKNSRLFLEDYPVVLSTTYSSRNTMNDNFKFDYIIMDESSQIDVVTGTLALSSAQYAVIIGDEKQLPNVIKDNIKMLATKVFNQYNLHKGYSYSLNSFLSSVKNVIPNIQIQLLKEHYRCHPKIINFCNKKFYNNELIIMTKDNNEKEVIKVIKTAKGNHSRGKNNQRQLDIIKELLPNLKSANLGIITPYNEQVDLIKNNIPNADVSTIHKFQGREKDIIIISTVEDDISEFVGDSNLLNVAISRAKDQLIVIVTSNEIKNRNIKDFIDYVEYNNMEIVNSKIYSVFDILYKQYELERLNFFKKNNRVLKFDSENMIYYLLRKIMNDYKDIDFLFYQPLNELINDKSLLTAEERKYAFHHNTHVDFRIYNKSTKKTIMVIEVDGYKYHKKGIKQYERDLLKNSILNKYDIPFVRLATNGSEEEKKIRNMLDKLLK